MKVLSSAMQEHLDGEVTTLATCWRVVRDDGTTLGFTDHDEDIIYESVTYSAATGISPSSIKTTSDGAVDNLDVIGILQSSGITDADILAKKYDFAEVYIFMVNYKDLTMDDIKLSRGRIGEIEVKDNSYTAEFRSLGQFLQQTIGERYSVKCRADLGDSRCSVSLTAYTSTAAITVVTDNANFIASAMTAGIGYYEYGKLTWLTGNNSGYEMEVKTYASSVFELVEKMPYTVAIGDTFSVYAGCRKTASICKDTFSNIINFRGEPFIPGVDESLKFGGQ